MGASQALTYALVAVRVVVVVLSVTAHELAHGVAAYRLGDPTAKEAGRLTLNPLSHLDPFGSVVLPVLLALGTGAVFGYAKPVPYNPARLRHRRRDELLVALAGPLSNLALGCAGAAVMLGVVQWAGQGPVVLGGALWWVLQLGYQVCFLNFVLFFFNILPVPPLDGSALVGAVLPRRLLPGYYRVKRYAMPALVLVAVVLPMAAGVDPFGWYLRHTAGALAGALAPVVTVAR